MRAFVAAVVVLPALAQIVPLAHHGATQHRVCPEHGELVHAAAAPARGPTEVAFRGATTVAGGHDHCAVLAVSSYEDATALRTCAGGPPDATDAVRPTGAAFAAIDVLRFAPKSSPPA